MATFPVATGARLLGIHPKTLHHWLGEANFPLAAHPTDARIKCVAEEHLLEVARRHGRPLSDLAEAPRLYRRSAPASREEQAKPLSAHEAELDHSAALLSAPSTPEVDLIQRLSCLETKIVTRKSQLAQLALVLRRRARANGRASHRGPGIAHTTIGGRASASRPPRARGKARACLRLASGASASSGRTTGSVSHACSDRIRRTRNLCDLQFPGRRVASGTGFD